MGLLGNKEPKQKTAKQLEIERLAYEKKQKDMLISLRTDSELKIEKSAIVTLGQISDVVRLQTIVNKNLLATKKELHGDLMMLVSKLNSISEQKFEAVHGMRVKLKELIEEYSLKLNEM